MLVGVLTSVSGLALAFTRNDVAVIFGAAMTYGGFLLAHIAFENWADDRDTARHVARGVPRLEAVLDRHTVAPGDDGAIAGRFRGRWLEVLSTSETYRVRVLLPGAGGLPWTVYPQGQGLELRSRSRSLEGSLRQAGVLTLVTDRPELVSFANRKCAWSVSYVVGHVCEVGEHSSTSAIEYQVQPRTRLWRHITDDDLRAQLGLLVDLANINSSVNIGRPRDVDPPATPARWLDHGDKVVKVAAAVAAGVVALSLALKVLW